MVHTFRKSERLCSRTVIDEIFSKGKELRKFPYLIKYIYSAETTVNPVQIVVSVPKKRAKSAVDRNRLRRQIKEAYRLNKDELQLYFQNNKCSIVIFLIYTGKEKEVYTLLEEKLKVILKELIHTVSCLK
ncbi:MAG: ribonuclease P protein component [Crocinitomicaceae bacterium]|nr:ribonuclease P protein component [Crocinitomicaceae bacterium]